MRMLLVTFAIAAGLSFGQGKNPLVGVWQEVEYTAGDGTKTSVTQPCIAVYTEKHFSTGCIQTNKPRPDIDSSRRISDTPDSEKLAVLEDFSAQTGTYEISGTTITWHTIVSKNPRNMHAGDSVTGSFKIEGNTLILMPSGNTMGYISAGGETKFRRLE